MRKRPATRKFTRVLLIAAALAVSAVLLGIVPFNAGLIRGPVETAVRDATGLELSIGDRIILRLGPTPSVTSGGLVFGDPASNPVLVIDSLHVRIGLFALLGGRVHVHELSASGVQIDYCSPFPGVPGNSNEDTAPPSVAVDAVELDRIAIRCGPPAQADPFRVDIDQVQASAPAGEPVRLRAESNVAGIDFTLTATGGELNQLLRGLERYPVDVSLESAAATVEASGDLRTSPAEPAIDARLELSVTDVQRLADAFGFGVPAVGALRAEGNIRSDFKIVELIEVAGELGESRFAFGTILDMTGERAHIGLTATLEQLDLTPFLDEDPSPQRPDQVAETGDIDLRPALDMLNTFDAQVQMTVARVLGAPLELDGVEITASLADGIVALQPLKADVLGGHVSIIGRFDSQPECPELQLIVRASELDFAHLNAWLALDERLGGHADAVNLQSSSCGHSLLAHRQSLRTEVGLVGGSVSLGDEPFSFVADRLDVNIKPGERSRVRLVGKFADEQVQATLALGSLEALLGSDRWPIELNARGAGSQLHLSGQARAMPGQVALEALMEFEAPHVGSLHPWTAGSPNAGLPLRATTKLRLDESRLVADAIALSLGGSDVGGRMVWNHAQDPDLLDLSLRSSYLDLDEIGAVFAATEQPESTRTDAPDGERRLFPAGVTLPPVDLDLTFDGVHARKLDLQALSISGRLRAGLIDDARISVVVEDDVLLRGNLELDLRRSPAEGALNVAAENVDIGRLLRKLEVSDDLHLRADALEILVSTEGKTLTQLLLNLLLEANLRGFDWDIATDDAVAGEAPKRDLNLSLAQLNLATAPGLPTIWTTSGQFDGVQLELWMESPSLVDTFGDTAELPLTVVVAAGNDVAMLEASVDRSEEGRLFVHTLLSGEVIESENRSLPDLVSPLADYEIQGDIILTEDKLELPDLQMRLGDSGANGSFTVAGGDERRHFDIVLHAPYLQTDDLLYWARDFRAATPDGEAPVNDGEESPGIDVQDLGDGDNADRGVFFMARDFVTELRESNDLDISITVDELYAGADLLGSVELRFYVDEDEFRLQPLTFDLPGGGVDAEYTWRINDGRLEAELKVHAEALSYGGLLRLADHESEARGLLYLDTEISTNSEWLPDAVPLDLLLRNANGSLEFAAWPENIDAGVLDLWTANLLLALLPSPAAGKSSKLNCVVARLDIENGVMKTRTALLDSTDTIIRGRGTISLAEEKLDLLVGPQAKQEKFLSASTPVKVTGPFNDFQIGVEPVGMLGTAMKWWMSLFYVPFKWLTGERFPADGTPTCFDVMDWELSPELHDYFLRRDFSAPPSVP